MRTLDECPCSCHQTGAVHIVACCTGVSKFGIPAIKPYAWGTRYVGIAEHDAKKDEPLSVRMDRKTTPDIHAYRRSIHDDCVIGMCSINNCLYPSCAKEPKRYGVADNKPDQFALKTGEQILADINAAFEAEFGPLIRHDLTPEEIADRELYYSELERITRHV